MRGLEGLINILDSEGGFGSLEMQLLPDQAANFMNLTFMDASSVQGLLVIFCRVRVTDVKELKAFVRTFGSYGVDRLERMLKEHTAALLNCTDMSLRVNREILEVVAGSMHSGDTFDTEANIKQIVAMDTMVKLCIQAGQAITFDNLLAEASGVVLEEGAPLIYSLLAGSAKHLPSEIPKMKEIRRMQRVANTVNIVGDHDSNK